jgi:hypothetical protein
VEENTFLECKPITDMINKAYMTDKHNYNDKIYC